MAESPPEQLVTQPPAAILEGLGSQGKCKAEDFTTYEELKVTEGQTNPLILACQKCRSKILRADKAILISREVYGVVSGIIRKPLQFRFSYPISHKRNQ